jgi:uncharacterized protein YqeY
MSSLKQRIEADLKAAAKAREELKLGVVRMLKSAVGYKEIEVGAELDDAGVVQVIGTLIKQRRDSVEQFTKANRADLADKESKEIVVLQGYLPQQLSASELAELVDKAIAAANAKSPKEMGAVMKVLQPQIAGRAEGKVVADLVKSKLTGK